MKKYQRGFTLMELMVVIVIVAILAAVAVPLYINYVRDARRTEAKGAIGAFVTGANKYFQENNTYAATAAGPGFEAQATWSRFVDITDVAGNWTFAVSNTSATGFQVDATGIAGTPAAGIGVRLVFTRGGAPVWTDDPAGP